MTGFIWLRKGPGDGIWCTQQWTSEFHTIREISWPAKWLSASQVGFCCVELEVCNANYTILKGKGKVVRMLFFKLSTTPLRRIRGVEVYLHPLFDLGTRWRWVVSFTPQLLYLQGKSPWHPLDSRLGGPQSRCGRGGEEKNSQPPPGIEP
jgi:hypothetical protein